MKPDKFLEIMAETANNHNFEAHMNLISKDVKVYGVPNFEVINYNDWYNQCKQEFEDKLLTRVSYQGLELIAKDPDKIMFFVIEIAEASDGHENVYCVEFTIQKEKDRQWRVVQERIMPQPQGVNSVDVQLQ